MSTIYRIFNGNTPLSTAIVFGGHSFLQVKPRRYAFRTQADWIGSVMTHNPDAMISITREDVPRAKRVSDMTADELNAHRKVLAKRKADRKTAAFMKRKEAQDKEVPIVKHIRALYDRYGLPDTLSARGYRKVSNPGLFMKSKSHFIPVYFSRKGSKMALNESDRTQMQNVLATDPSTVSFWVYSQKSSGALTMARLPATEVKTPGQKTIVYIRQSSNASMPADITSDIELLRKEGYHVKYLIPGNRSLWDMENEYKYDPDVVEVMENLYWKFETDRIRLRKNKDDKLTNVKDWIAKNKTVV